MKTFDLYTYIYNDEDLLPFFLEYYSFVDRMTFIDSGSNDRSWDIIKEFIGRTGKMVRKIETGLTFWDQETLHPMRNYVWKDSDYDLILFPDCDEIFYCDEGLEKYLQRTNFEIYEMDGFEMVSDHFPRRLTDVKTGFRHHVFNKSTIFSSKSDIEFLNAHVRCSRSTNVDMTGTIKLLHYRSLGLAQMIKINERKRARLPKGYKGHFPETDEFLKRRYQDWLSKAEKVI